MSEMRGTSVFLCLCGFGVIALAHYCDRSDGGMPGYGDKCEAGKTRCSKGRCFGTTSEPHANASECSGRCKCGRDNSRCLQSLVDVDVKPVPPEKPSQLLVNYTIHENHGHVKLRRLCFKHFIFTDVGVRILNQDCRQNRSRLFLLPEPGKGYVLQLSFGNHLEGVVIPTEKTYSRPALPKNIKIFTDVEGIPTVTWEQVGDVKSSKCILKGLDQGNHQATGHKNYCQFLKLPALVPFRNVTIQVSNHEADQVTEEHRLYAPYVFVPRVVKEVKVKEVGVSHVDFSVTETLMGSDVSVGFYVINGTRVGCGAVQINLTCSQPEELDRCRLGVSRVSLSAITTSEASSTSTAATDTTAATTMMMSTAIATGSTDDGGERDGEPSTEDGGVLLRVEGLEAATAYDIQLTPWFCANTDWQGYITPLSVSTLVLAKDVKAECLGGTRVLVSWQAPPVPENITYTVFLTDPTPGTEGETGGTQCPDSASLEAGRRVELCNVSYNHGVSNGTCNGSAPDAFWEYDVAVVARTKYGFTLSKSNSTVTTDRAAEPALKPFTTVSAPGPVSSLSWSTKRNQTHCGETPLNDYYKLCVKWRGVSPRLRRNDIQSYVYTVTQGEKVIRNNSQSSHALNLTSNDRRCRRGADGKPYHDIINVTAGQNYTLTIYAMSKDGQKGDSHTVLIKIPDVHPPDLSAAEEQLMEDSIKTSDTTIEFKLNNTLFLTGNGNGGNISGRGVIVTAGDKRPRECHASGDFKRYPGWTERAGAMMAHGYRVKEKALESPQAEHVPVRIGDETCDSTDGEPKKYCDGPLEKGTPYSIWVYVCNEEDCVQVRLVNGTTGNDSGEGLGQMQTAVVVVSICAFCLLGVCLAWRLCFHNKSDNKRISQNPELSEWRTLQDLTEPRAKRPMTLNSLASIISHKQRDGCLLLKEEFGDIVQSQRDPNTHLPRHHPHHTGAIEVNRRKNRQNDVITYEHSRVKLTQGEDGSDYINANFIPGYQGDKHFIATQGPLPYTINDFWRMVWEQDVHVIVMLTMPKEDGKIKCEQYWPAQSGETSQYDDVHVTNISPSAANDDYNITVFIVDHCKERDRRRELLHCHYLKWTDSLTDLSENSVLEFHSAVKQAALPHSSGPIVVHCSTGVGRTGVFIALDFIQQAIRELSMNQALDIYGYVTRMREYRCNIIDRQEQYIFIHQCARLLMSARQAEEAETGSGRQSWEPSTSSGIFSRSSQDGRHNQDPHWQVRTKVTRVPDPTAGRPDSKVTFATGCYSPGTVQVQYSRDAADGDCEAAFTHSTDNLLTF